MISKPQMIANRFELGGLVGHGGMGDVYRGLDTLTGQPVAIKFLKSEIVAENPELVARFEREGEALRALNHPNIVKMLATAEEDGQRCLIMEYVGGGSLRDLLKQQPRLPVDRVLFIALDLADALTRAHRLKIIHRDIKPANVLLAEDGTPRLSDFGVAYISDRTRVTESGLMVGTYAYISPEACMGEDLDARADIWSFGVMLFEMLAGRRPFDAVQPAAVLTAILTRPVPDLLLYREDVPPRLLSLIYAMLEKDRDKRVSSVRLVGAHLEAIISGGETPAATQIDEFSPTPTPILITPPQAAALLEDSPTLSPLPTPLPNPESASQVTPAGVSATEPILSVPSFNRVLAGSRRRWLAVFAALLIITALVLAAVLNPDPPIEIAPVQPGEYMVLVADFERSSGDTQDVTRFIARDLRRKLEEVVPFSQVRLREYPKVIRTDEEARAAAEAAGATVVVWGSYTPDWIEAEVQLGSTTAFPASQFDRQILERTTNVTLRLTDPRQESLVNPVLAVLTVLHLADGNGYEVIRTLAVLDQINATTPAIDGGGVSAYLHRFVENYVRDTPQAVDDISTAVTIDPGNALLYASRAGARQRIGQFDESLQDTRSAERSGPENWAIPLYLRANIPFVNNDVDDGIPLYDRIIELRPDDWFPYSMRAAFYYLKDDLERAKADYSRAIALKPNANFPYVISAMLSLREGRMADARAYMDTILHEFTDPLFASRITTVAFGDQSKNPFGAIFAAFGYLVLDQYDQLIREAQAALALDSSLSDLYALEGYAYCNLGQYAEAETAYAKGVEMQPDTPIGYALRAEVRIKQLNAVGAYADAARARELIKETGKGEELEAYITAGLLLQVGCTNFWDWSPPENQ